MNRLLAEKGIAAALKLIKRFRGKTIALAALMLTLAVSGFSQSAFAQGSTGTIIPPPPLQHEPGAPTTHQAHQDDTDPTRAYDPETGQNMFWDCNKRAWVNSKTGEKVPGGFEGRGADNGEVIPPPPLQHEPGAPTTHRGIQDETDPTHAFDPETGQNMHWDGDKGTWIDSKTGRPVPGGFKGRRLAQACPPQNVTAPPPPHIGPDAPPPLDLRYPHVPDEFCSEKDRDKFIKRELQPVLDRAQAQVAAWTDYIASLTALQTQSGDAQYHAAIADQIAQANATLAQANQFLAAVQGLVDDASHARIKDCPPTFSFGIGIGIGGGHDDNHGHNSHGSDKPPTDTPQPHD